MKRKTEKAKTNETKDGENSFVNFMDDFQTLWQGFFHEQFRAFNEEITSSSLGSFFSRKTKKDFHDFCREAAYDKIHSFFHNTALGPFREYQEGINRFGEAFRNWEVSRQNFFLLMYVPIEESWKELEREWGSHGVENKDNLFPDAIFRLWIEILERRYMALYESEEFVAAMNLALQRSADLMKARIALEDDFRKCHHLPTSQEMNELYKDIYYLRKRVESLEKAQKRKGKSHDAT